MRLFCLCYVTWQRRALRLGTVTADHVAPRLNLSSRRGPTDSPVDSGSIELAKEPEKTLLAASLYLEHRREEQGYFLHVATTLSGKDTARGVITPKPAHTIRREKEAVHRPISDGRSFELIPPSGNKGGTRFAYENPIGWLPGKTSHRDQTRLR